MDHTLDADMAEQCSHIMSVAAAAVGDGPVSESVGAWCGDAHDVAAALRSSIQRPAAGARAIGLRRLTEAALTVFVECAGELRESADDGPLRQCADACERGADTARALLRSLVAVTDQQSSGAT